MTSNPINPELTGNPGISRLQWAILNADSEDVGVLQDCVTILLQERTAPRREEV